MNYLATTIQPGVIVGDEVSAVYKHAEQINMHYLQLTLLVPRL